MEKAMIESYFVSDPAGHYLDPTYPTMERAQEVADQLNAELEEEHGEFHDKGSYVVGAHLSDGSSTFEIG